jgi:hypothetical protein
MSQFSQHSFANEKALIRVDFNVPLNDKFEITDDTRIRGAIPTIQKILKDGGSVILMSHFGRPKDGPTDKYSLMHLIPHLEELLGTPVDFANDCIGDEAIKKPVSSNRAKSSCSKTFASTKKKKKATKPSPKSWPASAMSTSTTPLAPPTAPTPPPPSSRSSSPGTAACSAS